MKIRQLKSGAWNVRVTVEGKTYSFTDKDKKAVRRMASAFADECRESIDNPPLAVAIDNYIDIRRDVLSPSTIRGYLSIAGTIKERFPSIAQKRVVALNSRDVQTMIKSLAPKTARNWIGLIQAATGRKYDVAIKRGKKKETQVPTDLEVLGLIRISEGTEMEIPVLLGAYGGLRRGEVCALSVQDFDGDFVHISKDMVYDEYCNWVIKPPKTESSNRTVLLPHWVVSKIRARGYVTNLVPDRVSSRFRRMQTALGVDPPYCFHSLRHYSASYLHAQGIPDAYIMSRGGWATPSVMQSVYRHALTDKAQEMEQKAVSSFQFPFQDGAPKVANATSVLA